MTKKMLIDAAHAEEVRVCVMDNGAVEDFDFESASRKPLRGNIYLARVTRIEPSLQAAFVEYGGNRHGFLAFNEIHPDYYQVPVSDRQALQEAEDEEAAIAAELEADEHADHAGEDELDPDTEEGGDETGEGEGAGEASPAHHDEEAPDFRDLEDQAPRDDAEDGDEDLAEDGDEDDDARALDVEDDAAPAEMRAAPEDAPRADAYAAYDAPREEAAYGEASPEGDVPYQSEPYESEGESGVAEDRDTAEAPASELDGEAGPESTDAAEGRREKQRRRAALLDRYREARRKRARLLRNYKIQEVIKRRQILLVQVVKEERGNKGAALTTFLSLAGRYCVLMPNTARGGGISRKIPVAADRRRLKRVVDSLEAPKGMGLIIRTAGAKRTKAEIKRDFEYLTRLWENIRTLTMQSIAPCLIYEEASLIKRAIRDLYDKDIGSITVEGDAGYREAKDFMKMLMPSHAKNVQPYKEKTPLFIAENVEAQLDAMYQPTVRLKSGGYIVIHQTEALVAIDVNSGKATRERNIELTALKTNLEAAREAARQCRLRDLAGLIVIDFIDMEEPRNNRAVEKRLKDALRFDRARLQVGRISNFGLLEMSRQRRRSGIVDGTTHVCPSCNGAGVVRSSEMAAMRILRAIEREALAARAGVIAARASLEATLYILNHKRQWLKRIEDDYALSIEIIADATKVGDNYEVERRGPARELQSPAQVVRADQTEAIEVDMPTHAAADDEDETRDESEEDAAERGDGAREDREAGGREGGEARRRGRRRRGRRGRTFDQRGPLPHDRHVEGEGEPSRASAGEEPNGEFEPGARDVGEDDLDAPSKERFGDANGRREGGEAQETDGQRRRRRRGRRGGRRNRREGGEAGAEAAPRLAAESFGAEPSGDAQPYIDEPHESLGGPPRQSIEPAREFELRDAAAQTRDAPTTAVEDAPRREPFVATRDEGPAREPLPDTPPKADRPTKKGWWQRAIGG
jgi:ribonuclease E